MNSFNPSLVGREHCLDMKTLILILLCAVIVNARVSITYGAKTAQAKHDGVDHELDWWEHGVFYQVK